MQETADNISLISEYLMEDLNTLYSEHVFPFQLRLEALENILTEKGIVTKEEIDTLVNKKWNELQEKAEEVRKRQEANEEAARRDSELNAENSETENGGDDESPSEE
jgi:hypothetical protein